MRDRRMRVVGFPHPIRHSAANDGLQLGHERFPAPFDAASRAEAAANTRVSGAARTWLAKCRRRRVAVNDFSDHGGRMTE
jgi:hypothetical protein